MFFSIKNAIWINHSESTKKNKYFAKTLLHYSKFVLFCCISLRWELQSGCGLQKCKIYQKWLLWPTLKHQKLQTKISIIRALKCFFKNITFCLKWINSRQKNMVCKIRKKGKISEIRAKGFMNKNSLKERRE